MANVVSEKLINFEVFDADEGRLLGLADVELPTLQAQSEEVSGAGIAGTVDSPTLGHYAAMSMTIKWRVTEVQALKLMEPRAHALELRGSIQRWNGSLGEFETLALKVVTRAVPKSSPLGTLAPGSLQEPSMEFSVRYIKIFLAGTAYVEIDPLNYIALVNGVDYLAAVRTDLGL